jgi:hypothetical protein
MAKMTVADQITNNDKYSKLQFVEFLEVICRAAYHWCPDEDSEDPFENCDNSSAGSIKSAKSSRSYTSRASSARSSFRGNQKSMRNVKKKQDPQNLMREFEEPQTK